MSEAAVDAAIAAMAPPPAPSVLDTGCGRGEILLRTLRVHIRARGLGVDLDADAIADARARAGVLPARFEVEDASCVEGPFDAVINVGSSHAHGGFPAALDALRALAPVALYGEGFWRRAPSEDFLDAYQRRTERHHQDPRLHAGIVIGVRCPTAPKRSVLGELARPLLPHSLAQG